ncbi:MAG: GntR family transcriptional regulator [Planctomycetota bacterium]
MDDIRRRGLKVGDSYLNTRAVAQMLGVNTAVVNRALQLLVQRRMISRRPRQGTIIINTAEDHPGPTSLQRVHLLVRQDYLKKEGLLADGIVLGIQGELPRADIQFNFLPDSDPDAYVRHLIHDVLKSRMSEGFVVVRGGLWTQRLIAASGIPTVVLGSLYPSITGPSWIDRDHYAVGKILTEYLLREGAEHLLVMMREQMLPGDHQTLDAIHHCIETFKPRRVPITLRVLPADGNVVESEIARQLSRSTGRMGLFCRSTNLADAAIAALKKIRLPNELRPRVAVCDVHEREASKHPFAYTRAVLKPEAIGTHIGRMLIQQCDSGSDQICEHEIMGVEFCD